MPSDVFPISRRDELKDPPGARAMKSYLRGLMWDAADVPDPDDPTFGTPTWFDELFVSITSMLP